MFDVTERITYSGRVFNTAKAAKRGVYSAASGNPHQKRVGAPTEEIGGKVAGGKLVERSRWQGESW
jgi:hypothetical protein